MTFAENSKNDSVSDRVKNLPTLQDLLTDGKYFI